MPNMTAARKTVEAMPEALRERVAQMIRDGYGASGIRNESAATLKQVNALFAFHNEGRLEEVAPGKPTDPNDANAKYRILDIQVEQTRVRAYILKPGDTFEFFGGHRNGLTVVKTPSLITSTNYAGTRHDHEYNVTDAKAWAWLKRCILREAGVELPPEE